MQNKYCSACDASKISEPAAVGRRIGKILDSLGLLNRWVCSGQIVFDCENLQDKLISGLRAEGWRISVNARDRWQVLPPKSGRKSKAPDINSAARKVLPRAVFERFDAHAAVETVAPNCDHGSSGNCVGSEVRILPAGGDCNVICCYGHYLQEIAYRIERNKDLDPACKFPLPIWETLKPYPA